MKKLALLERPIYQPMYRIQRASDSAYSYSRLHSTSRYGILRDAPANDSWETFDDASLPAYFANGIQMLQKNIDRLQDLSVAYAEADKKNLSFMIESLLQTRRLIEDIRSSSAESAR